MTFGMESFNKRSADIFGALDTCVPSKNKETSDSLPSKEKVTKTPQEIYTPPAKRSRTSQSSKIESSERTHPDSSRSLRDDQSQNVHHRSQYERGHHHQHNSRPDRRNDFRHERRSAPHRDRPRDPTKWTKYDLKDVGADDLSGLSDEQVNRRAAYQFLNHLKTKNQTDREDDGSTDSKIVFKKPTRRVKRDISQPSESNGRTVNETTSVGSRVRTMPEYVVGASGGNRMRKKRSLLTLSSSGDEDLEEEDSGDGETKAGGCGLDSSTSTIGVKSKERTKKSVITLSHLDESDD